jgi:hypothetical protein
MKNLQTFENKIKEYSFNQLEALLKNKKLKPLYKDIVFLYMAKNEKETHEDFILPQAKIILTIMHKNKFNRNGEKLLESFKIKPTASCFNFPNMKPQLLADNNWDFLSVLFKFHKILTKKFIEKKELKNMILDYLKNEAESIKEDGYNR